MSRLMAPLLTATTAVTLCGATAPGEDAGGVSALKHWPARELRASPTAVLLTTPTHLMKIVKITQEQREAASHEGTSDVFFVESGSGAIVVGGTLRGAQALPDMPGELRGNAVEGGQRYVLAPMAMVNVPPSTPYEIQADRDGLTLVQLRVNVAMHPWAIVQTQQSTLPPIAGQPSPLVPVNGSQGEVVYWSATAMQRAHDTLSADAVAGRPYGDPRSLVPIPATRTHAYNFMHRILGANGRPPGVEWHQGNTDIYFVIAGKATLMTQGDIERREHIPNRPGEDRGTAIANGKGFELAPGDVLNMPPEVPHQSIPHPGGYTYMLIKVNAQHYPWSLAEPPK